MRVILHAGFHKTGTTTLQQGLLRNAAVLAPVVRVIPRGALSPVGRSARAYATSRDPLDLALLDYDLARLLAPVAADATTDPRSLVISCEDLCGQMPGRDGVERYAAAPDLLRKVVATLTRVLPGASVALLLTTRAPADWLASLHAQVLRASRLRLDAAEFADRYREAADLDATADRIAAAVAPVPVHRAALEAVRDDPLGPLAPLIDLLDLPPALRSQLVPQPACNRRPACTDQLLALNRSDLDDAQVHAAKQALLRGAA